MSWLLHSRSLRSRSYRSPTSPKPSLRSHSPRSSGSRASSLTSHWASLAGAWTRVPRCLPLPAGVFRVTSKFLRPMRYLQSCRHGNITPRHLSKLSPLTCSRPPLAPMCLGHSPLAKADASAPGSHRRSGHAPPWHGTLCVGGSSTWPGSSSYNLKCFMNLSTACRLFGTVLTI